MIKHIFKISLLLFSLLLAFSVKANCLIAVWDPYLENTKYSSLLSRKFINSDISSDSLCLSDISVPLFSPLYVLKTHNDFVMEVLENNKLTEQKYLILRDYISVDYFKNLKRAVKYANDKNSDIFLITNSTTEEYPELYSKLEANLIDKIYEIVKDYPNILFVLSAGNNSTNIDKCINQLTKPNNLIFVGSINKEGKISKFSNYGNIIDFWTLGEEIIINDKTLSKLVELTDGAIIETPYLQELNGTSFSAPIITCLIAKVKENYPNYKSYQLKNELYNKFGKTIINEHIIKTNIRR